MGQVSWSFGSAARSSTSMALSEFESARAETTMHGFVRHRHPAYRQEVFYLSNP